MIDFDARYTVAGYRGVAFYLLGYRQIETEETEWSGQVEEDRDFVVAVMVGDDAKHIVDVEDLTVISEDDYCHECGQIGCHGDGR